jgi:protein-disulfide isomerase
MRFLFRPVVLLIVVTAGSCYAIAQKSPEAKTQKPSVSKPLAMVDGVAITEAQAREEGAAALDSLELQVLRAKAAAARNEHQILEDAVERLVEDKLLRTEAEKQGVPKEELLAREVQRKISEPTADEIDNFYKENQQRIDRPKEEVVTQIIKYMKKQKEDSLTEAFFDKLKSEHQVVRMIEPLRYNVSADGRPSLGPASAPVLLVLFSDFQCPYCKMFSGTIKEITQKYGNNVHLIFRQFPLTSLHPDAQRAAEASLCANTQGHFWEIYDLLFQDQNSLNDEDLRAKAVKLGLDVSAFNACFDSKRYAGEIREDVLAGSAAGLDGTPALFVNGRLLYGNHPYADIAAMIDEELKKK